MMSWGSLLQLIGAEYVVALLPLVLLGLWLGKERETALFAVGTVVVSLVVSYTLGVIYSHPAPYMVSATLVTGPPTNSFPSQHTTVMFAMIWPLGSRDHWWGAGLFCVAGVLVGGARVAVGFHYPSDILGGIVAAGIGSAIIAWQRDEIIAMGDWWIAVDDQVRELFTRRL